MRSTRAVIGVGSDPVVVAMVEKQLKVRERAGLPKSKNGHTVAPSNPWAAQILKDMGQGTSKEYARLYCVGRCNLDDGVPLEMAEAPILMLLAALRAHARVRTNRPLPAVMRMETKAQASLDLAQLRLAESPTCIQALEAVLAEAEHYTAPLDELKATVRERLTVARTSDNGPRRRHLHAMA